MTRQSMERLMGLAGALALAVNWSAPVAAQGEATSEGEATSGGGGAFRADVEIRPFPRDDRVGDRIEDIAFIDVDGRSGRLSDFADGPALVIVVRDVTCPVSRRYGPRLGRLSREFADRDVPFLFVNMSSVDTVAEIRAEAANYGFTGRLIADPDGGIGRILRADRTTDVFVLDGARTLVYRGAIDDQYGLGFTRDAPKNTLLRDALDAVMNKREVRFKATTAPGCVLELDLKTVGQEAESDRTVTYHDQVSRIIQQNCQSCHRPAGPGPFSLQTYEQATAKRGMIRYVLKNDIMPPWHADESCGPWENDRSLSERDKSALLEWVENGCTEGDVAHAPVERPWPMDWAIGTPDAVFAIPKAMPVPAEGTIDYRYQYVKTNFAQDRWITRIQVRPTAPQVVHHILVFVEEPRREGESRRDVRRRWQGGLHGYLAALVPGQGPTIFPEGFAKRLPAGAWLKFQIHYTANGTATEDKTEIAFVFNDGPPEHVIRTASAATTRFEIPAGAGNHRVVATLPVTEPATILSFSPHMHLRGKAFRYELIHPDGREELLLNVPGYDFNWQTTYKLLHPVQAPAGSELRATAWYDNSAKNPANPDATHAVEFGEQTWEEMMIGYFEWWKTEGEGTEGPTD